jgi:hypothetical protein
MNSIILSDDDFSSILDGNHETFKEIESKLIDVDDHGDSTYQLVIQNIETKIYYKTYYIMQKEWGIMDQDKHEFTVTTPITKMVTVWS